MLKLIFDTNALITSCKFYVGGLPVIKYIAERCEIYHTLKILERGDRKCLKYMRISKVANAAWAILQSNLE